jgi:ribosomal protein L13
MIVITHNNSKILEIKKLFEKMKNFLRNLSKKKKKSFSYTDDIGDLVVVINGEEYVVPTKSDIEAILKSKKNDFLDEDEAKRLLDV